ncbi:MAG: septum formation protein Maf [Chloroflexi bacterium RBG_19FT_COMBO_56_12]|nr:MAG: septum formation protein Maf [Chloroflexi bacterium RBG_19FT_COMBO_56_12]
MMLVLASNSPRRRQLLSLGGWEFDVCAADVDETPLPNEEPPAYVCRLAQSKARAAAAVNPGSYLFIAADTTVVDELAALGTKILGKPSDEADARRMLRALRGRVHQVYTALALYRPEDGTLLADLCCTDVPMRAYTGAEIEAYILSRDPLDKAGAYAIQHAGFHPVESLQGCFANVMGLPLCHLTRLLRRLDIHPQSDLPQACQDSLGYACPVFAAILRGEPAATATSVAATARLPIL